MQENDEDNRVVKFHNSQALIQIINANTTYCLWQRAGGKTGGGIGPRFLHLSETMPGSQVLLFSDTYDRLQDRIVPNICDFLENKMGLIEGIDFVKYKRPPDTWERPIIPLDKFEHVISFASGMALCLVSLRIEGSANAYNAQAAIGDEVKFCDESRINTEVLPALRGSQNLFGHLPEYLSVWMFTDKYGPKIKWLLKKREKVSTEAIDVIYTLQMEIFRLSDTAAAYDAKGDSTSAWEVRRTSKALKEKADRIRKNIIYVSDMKPYENLAAVGEFYFKMQKRVCKNDLEYDVAILNKDPDKVESCFYPSFTQKNKYRVKKNEDYDKNASFYIAFDYNFRISPLPIVQYGILPHNEYPTVNFIDALFTLHPLGLEDCIDLFCTKYRDHENKEVNFLYDHTAIGRSPLKTTFKNEVVRHFELKDWNVVCHFMGDAPDHDIKHKLMKRLLQETGTNAIQVNEVSCDQLIKSIEMSPARISGDKTKKDKSTETNEDWPAEDSTHFSDAFDMLLWGLFEWNILDIENRIVIPINIV